MPHSPHAGAAGVASAAHPTGNAKQPAQELHRERAESIERAGLTLVYVVSALSLVGFVWFGLNPERLAAAPGAVPVYGWMLLWAPRAQILVAFTALALFLTRRTSARWLPAFGAVYLLSLLSELAGTTVGLPFGPYHYTDGLGVKWLGHVPVLIPLSWFFMALSSYAIARWRFPRSVAPRVIAGSLVLLSWDLALDPAMSLVTSYWVWGVDGPYYGMPVLNLVGWYVTGLALMIALSALRADRWIALLPLRWLVAFYGANLLLPLGMSAAAGLWGAVAATTAAMLLCWLLAGRLPAAHPRSQ
jgi:putative membrane protein